MALVYDELMGSVKAILTAFEYKNSGKFGTDSEMDDEVEFWLDPELVVFESSPDEEDVLASTYEDLLDDVAEDDPVLSKEIVQTYLSTTDLILVVGSDSEDLTEIRIGTVDRSTGVALVNAHLPTDPKILEERAAIATTNTGGDKDVPCDYAYQLITGKNSKLTQTQKAASFRRLSNFMTAIDTHILSYYLGTNVEIREDL